MKRNLPFLLQELLTKNLISSTNSKAYKMLSQDYNTISAYLYNSTGLQLIKMNNSYKLQTQLDSKSKITNKDTPLTYQLYIYVTASLISREIGTEFSQQEIADEVLSKYENTTEVEKTLKDVIRYMENERFLESKIFLDKDQNEIKILKKLVQPIIYTGELKNNNISNLAKITNYLLTKQVMNKIEHPSLWQGIAIEDLYAYFEKFSSEDFGYKIIVDGNEIRAVCLKNKNAFPNFNNMKHRVLIDILPELQKGKELEDVYIKSKYYKDSIKTNELNEIIKEYNLLKLRIENEERRNINDI